MGLTVGQRRAVTKAIATRYKRADTAAKGVILDELCATTGWHRSHARKALTQALTPRIVRPRKPRQPVYGAEVVTALAFCWAVLGAGGEAAGADDGRAGADTAPLRGVDRQRRGGGRAGRDVAGDDGPPAGRGPGQDGTARPFAHQARFAAEEPDPDPDLGAVGRRRARVRGDRPGRARGRQRGRRSLLHPDRHRHRDRLDGEPARSRTRPAGGSSPRWRRSR